MLWQQTYTSKEKKSAVSQQMSRNLKLKMHIRTTNDDDGNNNNNK